jgi:hypothetical protein
MSDSSTDDILLWMNNVYGGECGGQTHWAIGRHPHFDTKGKYTHKSRQEGYQPRGAKDSELAAALAAESTVSDVFLCVSQMYGKNRTPGGVVARVVAHCDWDGDPTDTAECLSRVEAAGGFAVASGTVGHLQVYIPLAEPVGGDELTVLNRALRDYLPPGADHKIQSNDVLRPPGTFNHKERARGGQPTRVEWALRPNGARVNVETVRHILGISAPTAGAPSASPSQAITRDTAALDIAAHPWLVEELARNTGDRSADTMRIVGAAYDARITLPQARWLIGQRQDLAERAADMLARTSPRDDVLDCWLKAVDSRQERRLGDDLLTGGCTVRQETDGKRKLWKANDLTGMRQATFLAKSRIPFCAATILCGDEGIGKSLLWVYVAAAVTTGRADPALGIPARDPADVFLVITEDSWAEDVLPRLIVAGADTDRVHVICTEEDGTGSPTFPDDIALITEAGIDPALVVVDAWLDTVPTGFSVKDPQQARAALHPWKEAAGRTGAAILLLTHTNRLETANMRDKYGASAALRQKARMTLFALADPEQPGVLIVGPDKSNNTAGGTKASRFQIVGEKGYFTPTADHDGTVPALKFVGDTGLTIKQHLIEVAQIEKDQNRRPTDAEDWLREFLADGPKSSADGLEAAKANCYTPDQVRRAREKLRVKAFQQKGDDGKQHWHWELAKKNDEIDA